MNRDNVKALRLDCGGLKMAIRQRLMLSALLVSLASPVLSQAAGVVKFDGSLGGSTTAGDAVKTGSTFAIPQSQGVTQGRNLFHSFRQFDLTQGETAAFSGSNVNNVISRVTGGAPSSIDGTIRSDIPNANFWFINPKGMLFGPNASLDIGGSLHVSSADSIRLGDQGRFYANSDQPSTLVSVDPTAFGFLSQKPAAVTFQGSKMQVKEGQTLSVAAGEIALQQQAQLVAKGGQIYLLGMGGPSEVVVSGDTGPHITQGTASGSLTVRDGSTAHANPTADRTGQLWVRAGQVTIRDNGGLEGDTPKDQSQSAPGSPVILSIDHLLLTDGGWISSNSYNAADGGAITVNASGGVTIKGEGEGGGSGIYNMALSSGAGGNITVRTTDLMITEGGWIGVGSMGPMASGAAGSITVNASGTLTLSGSNSKQSSTISANSTFGSRGAAGSIVLHATDFNLTEGGEISSNSTGVGQGGLIHIRADRRALIAGDNSRNSSVIKAGSSGSGHGGDILIEVGDLLLTDGGRISSNSQGVGDSGTISVRATGDMTVTGASPRHQLPSSIQAATEGSGAGGTIELQAANLSLLEGGAITTSSKNVGAGGAIHIRSGGRTLIAGEHNGGSSNIQASSTGAMPLAGAGGSITIDTAQLDVQQGGWIGASSEGPGRGGAITIRASQDVRLAGENSRDGSHIEAATAGRMASAGSGGDITVTTPLLLLADGGLLATSSGGPGHGGRILIDAADVRISGHNSHAAPSAIHSNSYSFETNAGMAGDITMAVARQLQLDKGSIISSLAENGGGGNIILHVGDILRLTDASLSTSVRGGDGNGGNIVIERPTYIILKRGHIEANAYEGAGGRVDINSQTLLRDIGSSITASSVFGVQGTVTIRTPDTHVTDSLSAAPTQFFDAAALMSKPCSARRGDSTSSFVLRGKGGLPQQPGDLRSSWPVPTDQTLHVVPVKEMPAFLVACQRSSQAQP
ncbi:MAG: filamentous hemagglutinin N-terminal domain-containing protein [Magnetococcales bacterium]|nr:filamentous hemagglutinin N-terminal domain-containing protein [Magnetococcales bacterium]